MVVNRRQKTLDRRGRGTSFWGGLGRWSLIDPIHGDSEGQISPDVRVDVRRGHHEVKLELVRHPVGAAGVSVRGCRLEPELGTSSMPM